MGQIQRRIDFINSPVYSNLATKFRLINDLVEEYSFRYNDPWYGLKIINPNPSESINKISKAMNIYEYIGDDPKIYEILSDALAMIVQYKRKCDSIGIKYNDKLINSITDYIKSYTDLVIEFETKNNNNEENEEQVILDSKLQSELESEFRVIRISKELRELKLLLNEGLINASEFNQLKKIILKINK
ncbi:hypothetical protein IMX26_08185 [Clostridium sp. 'deep sea']|uniref:hypothetical protein n=1 Tax=Clostridium sp. 'deep sea' TaxID=2779445 RepID=UPI0018966A6D|nr:hypothetical protein [Clostridium sp. 'deep sea']QOR36773.1 hypothetical protein IMX26_08185 [Clostridium sp. 'deep sea']